MDEKKIIPAFTYDKDRYSNKITADNNKVTVDDDKSAAPSEIHNKETRNKITGDKIENLLKKARSIGLINVKGTFDNYTIKVQGEDNTGEAIVLSYAPIDMEETSTSSRFFYRDKSELNAECRRLHSEGYTQVQIAKELKISQSRVSQILKEK